MSVSVDCAMLTVELATLLDPGSRENLSMASQALSEASSKAYNNQTEENLYKENLMSGFECEAPKESEPQEPLNSKTQHPKCHTVDTSFTMDPNCQEMQVQEQHDMNNSASASELLLQETESSEQPENIENDAQTPSSDLLPKY